MAQHTLFTCSICDQPTRIARGEYGAPERFYKHHHGLVVTLGYSHGGWGDRRNWIDYSSGEVCHDCFRALEEMFKPAIEFIRSGGGRKVDNVQPMRGDEPQLERRRTSLLRLLPLRGVPRHSD